MLSFEERFQESYINMKACNRYQQHKRGQHLNESVMDECVQRPLTGCSAPSPASANLYALMSGQYRLIVICVHTCDAGYEADKMVKEEKNKSKSTAEMYCQLIQPLYYIKTQLSTFFSNDSHFKITIKGLPPTHVLTAHTFLSPCSILAAVSVRIQPPCASQS